MNYLILINKWEWIGLFEWKIIGLLNKVKWIKLIKKWNGNEFTYPIKKMKINWIIKIKNKNQLNF